MDSEKKRIDQEVEHHLEELEEQLRQQGSSPLQARREARRRFGNPERVREATRRAAQRSAPGWGDGVGADALQALRGLRRAPAFTAATVLTLAMALGAAIVVFGVVWEVLVRPLAVDDPGSLVVLLERAPEGGPQASPVSEGTFQDWRNELTTVREVAAWRWDNLTYEDPDRPEELLAVQVSGNLLSVLGIRPALGRILTPDDELAEGPSRTIMISHELWLRRFGGDPDVVGRIIPVEGRRREIVGVMPARLDVIGADAELFDPSPLTPQNPTNRGRRTLHVVARLQPDATVAAAGAEVAALGEQIAEQYPNSARGWSARAMALNEYLLGDVRPRLTVLALAVGLLLVVAALNVANLLLVRAADGRREMAVRAALGAGRARLVRGRLAESLALGLLGGAGGLLLAAAIQRWLVAGWGSALPRVVEAQIPWAAVGFGALLALGTGLFVGALPALREAERAISSLARGTAGDRAALSRRSRNLLVVAQLTVATVLLVGAGLLVRTVAAIQSVDLGFTPEATVAARVSLDNERYATDEQEQAYWDTLLAQLRALPGIEAAGLTSALPMDTVGANFDLPTRVDEALEFAQAPQVDFRIVGAGVMEALGFRLVDGRFIDDADRGGPPVAVVNRSLAAAFWPGARAVGQRIQPSWYDDRGFAEVVGVVEDTLFYGPMEAARTELYVPLEQNGWGNMTAVVRTRGDVPTTQRAIEQAFARVDPLLPPLEVFPVQALVDATDRTERLLGLLLTAFSLMALALAAAGVYGVLAYAVRLRAREMGVRLALGATRGTVTRGVLAGGVGLALTGVALGLAASVPSTRLLTGLLFGVRPLDPLTMGSVGLLLVAVAAAACLGPALRAARMDPVRILRDE